MKIEDLTKEDLFGIVFDLRNTLENFVMEAESLCTNELRRIIYDSKQILNKTKI